MDIKTFCKRFMIWTAVVVAVIMLILGLCFGRVIEETLFLEVMKWVVMTLFIIVIFEVFAYTLSQFTYHLIYDKRSDKEIQYVNYKIGKDSIVLFDSYLISKRFFGANIELIRAENPELEIWNRSERSLVCEWATHNLLYSLGMFRSRTASTDLNFKHKWYMEAAYAVVGTIALLFIK